jgi:hypothetical protein
MEPEQEPHGDSNHGRPPLKADAGRKLQGERNAADLRCQHQKRDQYHGHQWHGEEPDPEALAHCVRQGVFADGSQAAPHLYQEGDADHSERNSPDQLQAEGRTCLRRGGERAGLEKTADAGHQPEGDFEQLAHWESWAAWLRIFWRFFSAFSRTWRRYSAGKAPPPDSSWVSWTVASHDALS